MALHDASANMTSRVLTVTSLQQLKLQARILAPAICEVWSALKFFNAQSIAPNEICQLCQVYGHTHLLQEFSWKVFNHPPYSPDLAPCDFHLFLHLKKFPVRSASAFSEWQRWVSHSGSNPRRQISMTQGYESWFHGMINVSILEVNMLKNSSTLAVFILITVSIKLDLVCVNGPGKLTLWTRLVDYSGNSTHTLPRVVLTPAHYVFLYYRQIKIRTSKQLMGLSSVSIRTLLTVLNYRTSSDPLHVLLKINFLLWIYSPLYAY